MNRIRPIRRFNKRSGITLLEVILATAIFLGSLTAILQLMRLGHDSRVSAKLDAEAALRCESKMGEYVSGMSAVAATSQTPLDDDINSEWTYSTTIDDGGGESLLLVTVLVEHTTIDERVNAYFQLTRLMRDPQLFLDAALAADMEDE
jgi:general secretion pathway protein I